MSTAPHTVATLDDLRRVEGKAELIAERIVNMMPTGPGPGRVGGRIYRSLSQYVDDCGKGEAYTGTIAFIVPEHASRRRSFSPDISFYVGTLPADGMDFIPGPPTLAVEVRSKGDYGAVAEAGMAAKRADYFEAGTLGVWDVDPRSESVQVYRADAPEQPTHLRPGDAADAEPAVPGWRIAVDWIFAWSSGCLRRARLWR